MTPHPPTRCRPPGRGQSIVEYLVVTAALATLLTVPLPFAGAHGRCAAVYLTDSIRAFYQSLTYFISLP